MLDLHFTSELSHRITVYRRTREKGELGGERWTYAEHATGVKCLIQALPIRQAELGKYRVWFEIDAPVQEGDHIEITTHNVSSMVGERYQIEFLSDAGGQGHHLECDIGEISGSIP